MDRSVDRDDVWGDDTLPDGAEDIWAEGFTVPVPKQLRTGGTTSGTTLRRLENSSIHNSYE